MLSAQSFSELSDRYQYYETTAEIDSDLIDEIERLNAETDARREQVADEKDRIAEAKLQLEKDRSDIASVQIEKQQMLDVQNAMIAEKEDVLRGQLTKKAELERLDAQLQRDSQEIQGLLSRPTPGGSPTYTGGQFVWPANGPVTSPYGYRTHPIFGDSRLHTGVDIGAPYGSAVFAASGGRVVFAGTMSGYGNAIVVDHGGGVATTYNHLSGFGVSTGSSVNRGQTIGSVGCTGYCTGPSPALRGPNRRIARRSDALPPVALRRTTLIHSWNAGRRSSSRCYPRRLSRSARSPWAIRFPAETGRSSRATQGGDTDLSLIEDVYSKIKSESVDPPSDDELVRGAVKGMAKSVKDAGDDFALFYSPKDYQSFQEVTTGQFSGIGVWLKDRSGRLEIVSVIPSTPAQKRRSA